MSELEQARKQQTLIQARAAQQKLSVFGTPLPKAPPGAFETLDDTVRMLASGASFGFADEMAAGLNAMLGLGTYEENLKGEMARDAGIREREPVAALATEVIGGVGGALAGGKVVGAVPAAGVVASSPLVQGVPKAVKYGTLGATAGAVSGAGNAQPGERKSGAIFGGALGAALGGVGIPLGKVAVDATIRKFMGTGVGKEAHVAAQKILKALRNDDLTPDAAFARIAALGPEGRLVDVGQNTQRLGRAVAGEPGKASKIAVDALEGRQAGQGSRMTEAVNKALDPTGDFAGMADDLQRIRKDAAQPLYKAAYETPIVPSERLVSLFRRPALEKAWRRAQTIARNEGDNLADDLFVTRPDGGKVINPDAIRDMKALDYIKRGLDDMVETSRDPVTGKIQGDVNRGVDNLRRQYVAALDELSPDYKAARAAWSGPSRSLELMDRGRRFARADEELTARQIESMTPDEKFFFRVGAARELRDRIYNTADGADAVKRVFGSELKRRRLRNLFPDDESYKAFQNSMEQESQLYGTRAVVSPRSGSQTQPRQADAARLTGDAASDLAMGNPITAAKKLVMGLFGRNAEGLTPAQSETIARALFTNDPAVNKQIVRALSVQRLIERAEPAFAAGAAETGRQAGATIAR